MIIIISSLLSFIFALWLVFYTHYEKGRMERNSLANLLKRELEHNIILIDEYIINIKHDLNLLEWAKPIYWFSPRYDLFNNYFIDKAFKAGIIYNSLDNNQVKIIVELLSIYTIDRKKIILDRINSYKNSETDYDDEGVPTTGKDYVEMYLQDQLNLNKKMQDNIRKIIPLIKYEQNELWKMFNRVICFIKNR